MENTGYKNPLGGAKHVDLILASYFTLRMYQVAPSNILVLLPSTPNHFTLFGGLFLTECESIQSQIDWHHLESEEPKHF